jgi:DNA modification methylase
MPSAMSNDLTIERLALRLIRPDPRNPRRHRDRQIKQIALSIQNFGFNVPILVDRANRIIAGHGRFWAAEQLQLAEVPALRIEHLNDAQCRAFMIADNRLTEMSVWDDDSLADIFKELSALNLDFDIEATGFTVGEIDLRIENFEGAGSEPNDETEPPIAAQTGPAISKPGDLWTLGDHHLYCGNALDPVAYQALMQGRGASVGFTDPPYNVKIDGHASGLGNIRHREFAMAYGEMNEAEFTSFLTIACTQLARNSVKGAIHFICTDWRHVGELVAAGRASLFELLNVCVWCKQNAGMGSLYRSQHELVFVFKSGRGRHRNNIQLGRYGRNRTNVWSYPGANSFGRASDEGNLLELHPTVKPVRLVADAILDCSARGDVVLDPFLGSGTTLMAAERVGRICYGMEIDPLYVDTAVRRWQAYSGQRAVHALKGMPFPDTVGSKEATRG